MQFIHRFCGGGEKEGFSWRNEEINRYNAAARLMMESQNVPINDLHAIVTKAPDALLDFDQVHLSDEGINRCVEAVAVALRNLLNGPGCRKAIPKCRSVGGLITTNGKE